jgi:hypothetical protein
MILESVLGFVRGPWGYPAEPEADGDNQGVRGTVADGAGSIEPVNDAKVRATGSGLAASRSWGGLGSFLTKGNLSKSRFPSREGQG